LIVKKKISDEAEAERGRKKLLELQAESAAVEANGQAIAEARARANAAEIEGEAAVKQSTLSAEATRIKTEAELKQKIAQQGAEVTHQKELNEIEIKKSRDMATIEATKFKQVVNAIGADTISSIAQAGPEMQVKLLKGLGLQGFMITDGNSPINLFNTAQGLIGGTHS